MKRVHLHVVVPADRIERLRRRQRDRNRRARREGEPRVTLGDMVTKALDFYLAGTVAPPARAPLPRADETKELAPYDPRDPHPCDGNGFESNSDRK